jgi:L-lactate dehydrogenase
MVRITGTIVRGENSFMTVSTLLDGEFGISDVCLSVPSMVSDKGVSRIIESPLANDEIISLTESAAILREAIRSITG